MHHYTQGITTRQAHKGIPTNLYEEEQGLLGFFGPVSHLLRKKPSTKWTQIDGQLKPRMFDLVRLPEEDRVQRLFFNAHLSISWQWVNPRKEKKIKAFRNAD